MQNTTDAMRKALEALRDSNELLRSIGGDGAEQSLAQIHDNYNAIAALEALAQPQQSEPIVREFFDLPLGTRFRYIGGKDVWVIIDRSGYGKVAKHEPPDGSVVCQSLCSFADTEQECRAIEVEVLYVHARADQTVPEWLPIESAPKTGTEFQAWLGHWEPRCRINHDTGAFEIWGRVDYDMDGWDTYSHLTATHFMPLPLPPQEPTK